MTSLFGRIRWRLVAWTMLVLGLILAVVGFAVYSALARSLLDEVDRNLEIRGDQAAGNFGLTMADPRGPEAELRRGGIFYLAVDSGGRVVANPQRVDTAAIELPSALSSGHAFATVTINGQPVRVFTHPLLDGPPGSLLVVGQSLAPEVSALRLLVLVMAGGGALGLLLSFGGAWFLAGRALVPIQQAFRRQQEFVADASHELRTPLTVLRSATDLLDQHRAEPLAANGELLDDVRAEIGRLQRLTGDLLTLARSDREQLELAVASVDLDALAADTVRRLDPLAVSRGVELTYLGGTTSPVEADPDRLQQVLVILLDNALKHTPPGGRVSVSLRGGEREALLEVSDTGPGIAAEHLPHVFERFYRADASRSSLDGGTGLGLAIAKTLVDAHGGDLSIASQPGEGTRATIRLRATAPASLAERIGGLATRIAHPRTPAPRPRKV